MGEKRKREGGVDKEHTHSWIWHPSNPPNPPNPCITLNKAVEPLPSLRSSCGLSVAHNSTRTRSTNPSAAASIMGVEPQAQAASI